jgi:hypothetical protein
VIVSSVLGHKASNDWVIVNNELERMWEKCSLPDFRYYPGFFRGGPEKIHEKSSVRTVDVPARLEPNTFRIEVKSVLFLANLIGDAVKD